jgi:putative transposase
MSPDRTFVRDYKTGLYLMSELVEQYGISRKTGYKWLARYAEERGAGLWDRSRRPHHSPQATDTEVIDALIAMRHRHPRWGAKKLLALGRKRQPTWTWPSRSTASAILKREGLITRDRGRRRQKASSAALAPITAANGTWTTDFKGEFRTGDSRYCYPLTVRDGWSRFVLRCDGLLARTFVDVQRRFARAFAEYGLPDRIRSDNGLPFAGIGLSRLSRLAVWWMRLGIVPERIMPGHPEQNGSHEQFHAILKAETARPPAAHLRAQQRRFDRFCTEYNHERPHEALDYQVPADRYQPSSRRWPDVLPPLEYPGHLEVRLVSRSGEIGWRGCQAFLSETLAGEHVGFEEVDDGLWTVYFATIAVARFDERQRSFHPIAAITTGALGGSCSPASALHPRPPSACKLSFDGGTTQHQ